MKRSCDCVVGLRQANLGSGVGLFNRLLAEHLRVPHVLLDEYGFPPDGHPLLSLKFEELSAWQRRRLAHEMALPGGRPSLYLHTLEQSELETLAASGAARVLCGNDYIYRALLAREGDRRLVRAFAPSLIPDAYHHAYQPSGHSCFTFGMASKVDRARFTRLRDLAAEAQCDIQLLCSFSIHQTSDGRCLPQTLDFLTECFGDRFVYLGTLTDQGIAYLLNTCPIFVGFYQGGVRSNNTTFNTALRFGKKIITNLDVDSPDEQQGAPHILNLDGAQADHLEAFFQSPLPTATAASQSFTWDKLVALCRAPLEHLDPVPMTSVEGAGRLMRPRKTRRQPQRPTFPMPQPRKDGPMKQESMLSRLLTRGAALLSLREKLNLRQRLEQTLPLDYAAHPIRMHVDAPLEADCRTNSCAKEPGTVAWIEENLRPGDVLYDIGANVGAYALVAAKHTRLQATIVAFEPSYANFSQLCRNVLLNDAAASIIPLNVPLCRQSALGDFHFETLTIGAAMHSFGQAVDYQGRSFQPAATLRAIGFSLDDLVRTTRLPVPSLIKIDVDGLEPDILEGRENVLRSLTLRTILLEVNEDLHEQCSAVLRLLHAAGLVARDKHFLRDRAYNYVFERAASLPTLPAAPHAVPVTWARGQPHASRRAVA